MAIRQLVAVLDSGFYERYFFVILLDRRTVPVQEEVAKLIRGKHRFVLGVAIEEIEAWWLGDRTNTLKWSGLKSNALAHCVYGDGRYQAERDPKPKTTLDELTRHSVQFGVCYGDGNLDLATQFAEDYWRRDARLDEITTQCPRGFARFQAEVTQRFRAAARRSRR